MDFMNQTNQMDHTHPMSPCMPHSPSADQKEECSWQTPGMAYVPSAPRVLREELGVTAQAEALIPCGLKRVTVKNEFHEHPYVDRQVCNVYLMWMDRPAEEFVVQREEIESVMWMEYQAVRKAVTENTIPNCIDIEELDMIEKHFED